MGANSIKAVKNTDDLFTTLKNNNPISNNTQKTPTTILNSGVKLEDNQYNLQNNTSKVDDIGINPSEITPETVNSLMGNMTEEEYSNFTKGVEKYYDNQINVMKNIKNGPEGLDHEYATVHSFLNTINSNKNNPNYASSNNGALFAKISELAGEKISSYEQLVALDKDLQNRTAQIDEFIKQAENNKKSAKYDYLVFKEDYKNYNYTEITQEHIDCLYNDSSVKKGNQDNYMASQAADNNLYFSFNEYHKKHPEISPIEYIQMLEEKYPGKNYIVVGLGGVEGFRDLQAMVQASDVLPDFAKTYSY